MSKLREAAQALIDYDDTGPDDGKGGWLHWDAKFDALRAALAEQCQCGDRPAAECPGAWEPGCDLGANEAHAKVHEPQEPDAYRYALGLASSIWSRHYKDTAPGWKPLDDLVGLLSQIDNMVTGLVRQEKAALAEPKQKPWRCACGANLYIDENGAPRSKA